MDLEWVRPAEESYKKVILLDLAFSKCFLDPPAKKKIRTQLNIEENKYPTSLKCLKFTEATSAVKAGEPSNIKVISPTLDGNHVCQLFVLASSSSTKS